MGEIRNGDVFKFNFDNGTVTKTRNGNVLSCVQMTVEPIPVGDAKEVDFHDAGFAFYSPNDVRARLGIPRAEFADDYGTPIFIAPKRAPLLRTWSAQRLVPRCLADDLATREFFEHGPKPAESIAQMAREVLAEHWPARLAKLDKAPAKPPLAGFDVVHQGRRHL